MIKISHLLCLGRAKRLTQGQESGKPAEDDNYPYL